MIYVGLADFDDDYKLCDDQDDSGDGIGDDEGDGDGIGDGGGDGDGDSDSELRRDEQSKRECGRLRHQL